MNSLAEIITELIRQYGGKAEVARKMGEPGKENQKKFQVKLGQYEKARQRPKADFIQQWKDVFGDDLLALEQERNVSRGTKKETKPTLVGKATVKGKQSESEEIRLLIKNIDRMGQFNEYLLSEIKRLRGD